MPKTILEKLFFKPNYTAVLLRVPADLTDMFPVELQKDTIDSEQAYDFVFAFVTLRTDLSMLKKIKDVLPSSGILWLAYPKGKALHTDLNRDILHEAVKPFGFDGVSLISLNDTWSAMRFKIQ